MAPAKPVPKITARVDFEGIEQVWPPQDAAINTTFDLVFVHGLTGGSITTWIHENGQLWLNWLIDEMPYIRIFLYGYRAHQVYLKPENEEDRPSYGRLFTDAEDLCNALRDNRQRMEHPSPTTLIGHGVGGIIVKNALVFCHSQPSRYGHIRDTVHHIMFLDTPHRGLDTNAWLAIYGEVATERAREQIGLWSRSLIDLARHFGGISQRFNISSIYSTKPVETIDGPKYPIDEASSVLCFPNEIPLHLSEVSHFSVGKCWGEMDVNYKKLRDRIFAEIRNHQLGVLKKAESKALTMNATRAQDEQEKGQRQKLKSKMLKWLMPKDQAIDCDSELESDRANAAENTCTWIYQTEQYDEWKSSATSSTLWIHGIQGSGKSTPVASTCQAAMASQSSTRVLKFFFKPESSFTAGFALSCLSHQMLDLSESVLDALQDKYERTKTTPSDSITSSKAVFKKALQAFGDCTIFVDALDNCKDKNEILKIIGEIPSFAPSGVKLLCSSRDEHEFIRALSDKPNVISLQITEKMIQADISVFINTSIRENSDLMEKLELRPKLLAEVISELIDGAKGMFLLPKFFIEDLSYKTTVEEIREFVQDLPRDLQDYYLKIVSRMDGHYFRLARCILTWTVWVRRPLSLLEVEQVLSMKNARYLNLAQDIKRTLGCLVTLDDSMVRLSHDSVRRFIRESSTFKASDIYQRIMPLHAQDDIAEACTQFVAGVAIDLQSPSRRFERIPIDEARHSCPFMEYASLNWIYHWTASSDPWGLLPSVAFIFMSPRLLTWIEWAAEFLISEGFDYMLSTLKRFLSELRLKVHRGWRRSDWTNVVKVLNAWRRLHILRKLTQRVVRLETFLRSWDDTMRAWPHEIYTFAELIDAPLSKHKAQSVLLTANLQQAQSAKLYNSLDSRPLPRTFDRFALGDLHLFMWQSLMPSTAWNLSYIPLNPNTTTRIKLHSTSLETGLSHARQGKDFADIGAMAATTIIRKDLRAVAICWSRFREDKSEPMATKTYAWYLEEDPASATLYPFRWSYLGDDDPCRVDLTLTYTFYMSKCATAFTDDLEYIWTPGGSYNLYDGRHRPAPILFRDSKMKALTFAPNASIIAGVRNSNRLEVYRVPDYPIADYEGGDITLLAVSNLGSFVLFMETSKTDDTVNDSYKSEPKLSLVALLSSSGHRTVLWTEEPDSDESSDQRNNSSVSQRRSFTLSEFYNHGGLHAFSHNDAVLVLCIPTAPDWELLAFDLTANNIGSTVWRVDYEHMLSGAGIFCLSFCPKHERCLYLLDSYSVMHSLEIARADVDIASRSQISTLENDDIPPVWTLTTREPDSPVITITQRQRNDNDDDFVTDVIVNRWRWDSDLQDPISCYLGLLAEKFLTVHSQTLTADISPLLGTIRFSPSTLDALGLQICKVQESIESTFSRITGFMAELPSLDLTKVPSSAKRNVSTNTTFDLNGTLGFFQSVVYVPIPPDDYGQARWAVSMLLDVIWLETPAWRKTGRLNTAVVIGKEKECLAIDYHPPTHTVIYSYGVRYYSKAKNEHWISNTTLICHLSAQMHEEFANDSRPNVLFSEELEPDWGMVESLRFSPCGRYVFGCSTTWPSSVFQLDINARDKNGGRGKLIKEVFDPFLTQGMASTTLSFYKDELYIAGNVGAEVTLLKDVFDEKAEYKMAFAACCPLEATRCDRLSLIWPTKAGEQMTAVCHSTNYLRKDGKFGNISQWPVAVSIPLNENSDWVEVSERDERFYFPPEKDDLATEQTDTVNEDQAIEKEENIAQEQVLQSENDLSQGQGLLPNQSPESEPSRVKTLAVEHEYATSQDEVKEYAQIAEHGKATAQQPVLATPNESAVDATKDSIETDESRPNEANEEQDLRGEDNGVLELKQTAEPGQINNRTAVNHDSTEDNFSSGMERITKFRSKTW